MIHQDSPTIIRIPAHSSVFDDQFIQSIHARIHSLNDARDVTGKSLIFVAEGPLEDDQGLGNIQLQPINLHEVLSEKLKGLSRLVQDISSHRLGSIWISSSDCTGIWWEFALACSTRIWFGDNCRLGFPESRQGQISSLGIVAKACARNQSVMDFVVENSDFSPLQAQQSGWVDALFPTSSLLEVGQFVELLQSGSQFRSMSAQFSATSSRRSSAWWQGFLYSRTSSSNAAPRISGSLQALRDVIKSSDGTNLNRQIETILIPIRARELLDNVKALTGNRRLPGSLTQPEPPRLNAVQIRASGILPPTLVIRRIIDHRIGILLFDSNTASLVRTSEVLESRLRKLLAEEEWLRFRERQLVLFHSDRPITKLDQVCALNWSADETVELTLQGHCLRGIVLEGSDSGAQLGPVEFSNEHSVGQEFDAQIGTIIGQHFATSWLANGSIPVSSWIRIVALVHLNEICSGFAIPMNRAITELRERRWRFLGDEQRIGGFMRTRQNYWPGTESVLKHCGISIESRQLKALDNSLTGKVLVAAKEEFQRKDLSIDLIAKVVAGTVYVLLCELELTDRGRADRLVSASLGFPTHGNSVRNYLQDFGGKAVLSYAKKIFSLAGIENIFGQHFRT
jgi:hypothetical protein